MRLQSNITTVAANGAKWLSAFSYLSLQKTDLQITGNAVYQFHLLNDLTKKITIGLLRHKPNRRHHPVREQYIL